MSPDNQSGKQEPISPTTAVEAYLKFVLNDLSQATNQMRAAASELQLAAKALEQKEMELAIKMDEVGSRLMIDIKRRASVITEEELRRYRASIGVQDTPAQASQAPQTSQAPQQSAPRVHPKKPQANQGSWIGSFKRWLGLA